MSNNKMKVSHIIQYVTAGDSALSQWSDDDNDDNNSSNDIETPQNLFSSNTEVSSVKENDDEDYASLTKPY